MFKKPVFWIILAVFSVGCTVFTFLYFSKAFPIVNLDLKMDRVQALQTADSLAQNYNWTPAAYQQAASFALENEVQNFVELEAGGTEAFNQMLQEGLYSPYTWRVRHFKEGETHETRIRFTPAGQAYGFKEKLAEDAPGATLTADSARAIAEASAITDWEMDFSNYELVEESEEIKPGGRTDHTFVYERTDAQLGEGRYRLRLMLGGDQLTELTHFIKIPEAFSRRYEEMRSANNTLGLSALIAAGVLYILGGCIIGLFFLMRQRWVIWRKAVYWAFFIAFLQFLAGLNQLPLSWMNFDTALSSQGFLLQQIIQLLAQFLFMGVVLALSFIGAESLSRKAFPHHIQHWRLWSSEVASSPAVLGRTVSGYLFVSVFLAFDVALYFFATNILGWWTPSEALFQPDLLATYLPWLSSIAISAQAGFWEECLFRAVPIAGAALLGQRFGGRRAWIVAAFVVQALVFGAGHAAYPQQPAYARIVELIIPSIGFGLLYLYFGLLPAIVLHYAVDVVYIALPLFVSSSAGVWLDQLLVILFGLVPLWVVLRARLKTKSWNQLRDEHYNRAWQPPAEEKAEPVEAEVAKPTAVSATTFRLTLIGGVLGLLVWIFGTNFQSDAPPLNVGRGEAQTLADNSLTERNVTLSKSWRTLTSVETPLDQGDRFIWQEGGEEVYHDLLGTYLRAPYWRVRFAQFEGDVAERAEEFRVAVASAGNVTRIQHQLPEARSGKNLDEPAARAIADSVIKAKYQLDTANLKFISSDPSKLEARTDWEFTFADTTNYPLEEGEARITVEIAGNEPTDAYRYVHVPEEWERQERNRKNIPDTLQTLCGILIFVLILAGAIGAIVRWSRKAFSASTFFLFFALLFGLRIFRLINNWPAIVADFSTAEPFSNQAFTAVALSGLGALFIASGLALIAGLVQNWRSRQSEIGAYRGIVLGVSLGVLVAGLVSLAAQFTPSLSPTWPDYSAAGSWIPFLGAALQQVEQYIISAALLLLLFTGVDRFTRNWHSRKFLVSFLLVLAGLVFVGVDSLESVPSWLFSGFLAGLMLLAVYVLVFRFHLALVPLAVAAIAILDGLKEGLYQAYPTALFAAILGVILIGVISFFWFRRLSEATST